MLTFLAVLATLHFPFALAAGGAIGFLLVPDPVGVVQCEPYTIQWQGGTAPFSVTVQDPVTAGDIYAFWADVSTNSILWTVDDLPKGSTPLPFLVSVTDSNGTTATSRAETVQAGTIPLDSSGLCTASTNTSTTNTSTTDTTTTTTSTSASTTPSPTTNTQTSTKATTARSTGSTAASSGSSPASTADASSASGTVTTVKKVSSGTIAGAVVGGVVLIALLGTVFQVLHKRHRKQLLADLTENDYHLALSGRQPAAEVVVEKPLPAFYEHPTPGSTPPPSSGYYHDASPPLQSYPPSGYSHKPLPSPYHDTTYYSNPHPADVSAQQMERQINIVQQEINGMQHSNVTAHTQALQNQVNTMRVELERLKSERPDQVVPRM
ncbi:hypothetical protein C8R44DRAFT_339324 [Mycena epipterygia]|nr:hypothetical protein C8R44DRAFT_339324 [Mycena epipterygia]